MYSIYQWKHLRTHHFASSKKKNTLSKVWLLALQKRLATPLTCMYYDLRDNKEEDNNANRDFI